ncbi:hypothetical protein HU200_026165 [Digitaria exilis]|uniref:Cytochrome P450 n=1 Tax=Digitaria exilis TaxID=1010633 RepID=A0A835BX54_9POAL|nr:hypothetical protein HU200_026165 [Digitaria exilis]
MERFYYVAAVTVVLLVLLHHLLMRRRKRHQRLPPGPRFAFPILGHLPLLKKPLQSSLADLAARHGPIVHLRLGARSAFVIGSASLAKECFSGELDVAIANRPHFPSVREASFDYSVLTLANYGAHWRTMRRVATVHLLSAHRVNVMSDSVIARELRAMVRRLARASAAAPGGVARVELKRRLFELSHSVLMEIMAQTRNTYSDDADEDMSKEAREMKGIIDAIVSLAGVANVWDYMPLLRWLDVYGVKRKLTDAVNRRNVFVYKMIDAEREKLKQLERKNGEGDANHSDDKLSMIGVMLSLQKTEPDVYTDTFINALVANLLGVATETTTTTLEWTMALLLNHTDVLKKAQEEIDSNVGEGRLLDKNDLPHLPYLHCIINETLRLYPAAPLLLPHEASTDCKIHGYDVPAGSMVLVNAYAIHRDPTIWEDPEEFRPERFEHGKAEGKFMMPFGMGRRKCPGENLAMRIMGLDLGMERLTWQQALAR